MLLSPPHLDRRREPITCHFAHAFGRSSISHSNETYSKCSRCGKRERDGTARGQLTASYAIVYRNGTSPLELRKAPDQPWTNEAGICPSGEFAFRHPNCQPIPSHEDQIFISKYTLLTKRHPNATTSAAANACRIPPPTVKMMRRGRSNRQAPLTENGLVKQ